VLGLLQGAGYERTDNPAAADVILINTCAVREKAMERVWGRASTLATYKTKRPHVVLGITGCMAEHLRGQVRARAPFVDLVVGPDGYRRLVAHIDEARAGAKIDDTTLDAQETYQGLDDNGQPGVLFSPRAAAADRLENDLHDNDDDPVGQVDLTGA